MMLMQNRKKDASLNDEVKDCKEKNAPQKELVKIYMKECCKDERDRKLAHNVYVNKKILNIGRNVLQMIVGIS